MNRWTAAKVTGLTFATVMAVSPSSCQSLSTEGTGGSSSSSSSGTRLVVTADSGVCWRVTVDGTNHTGCGSKTYRLSGTSHSARLYKTSGSGSITLVMTSNGTTVDSGTVKTSGHYVSVVQSSG